MLHIQIIDEARRYYDFNWMDRHYHNWAHALAVVGGVQVISGTPSPELMLAAYWHDAVYIPGAGSDANERCSAAALNHAVKFYKTNENAEVIEKAAQLIRCTSVDHHLTCLHINGDLGILLDADLFPLCLPYEDFVENQIKIIAENGGTYEEHKSQSAEFLKQFLECREFIYHTDLARSKWEHQARANIERYLKE